MASEWESSTIRLVLVQNFPCQDENRFVEQINKLIEEEIQTHSKAPDIIVFPEGYIPFSVSFFLAKTSNENTIN